MSLLRKRWFWRLSFLSAFLLWLGYALGPAKRLRLNRLEIKLARMPAALDGLTIAVIGDTHLARWVSDDQIRQAVEMSNMAHPDVVVLVGDYVSSNRKWITPCVQMLSKLKARYGVYAVLGNHEYWLDAPAMTKALQAVGIKVLVNENAALQIKGEIIYLAGVGDLWTVAAGWVEAYRGISKDACVVLLSHNPDVIYDPKSRKASLVISGHNHGGQIAWLGRLFMPSRYGRRHPAGLFREGKTQIFITTGVGDIFPPVRTLCRPEVAVLHLRAH